MFQQVMQLCRINSAVAICVDFNVPIASPVVAILDAGRFEEELPTMIYSVHFMRTKQVESMRYWNLETELTVAIDPGLSKRMNG